MVHVWDRNHTAGLSTKSQSTKGVVGLLLATPYCLSLPMNLVGPAVGGSFLSLPFLQIDRCGPPRSPPHCHKLHGAGPTLGLGKTLGEGCLVKALPMPVQRAYLDSQDTIFQSFAGYLHPCPTCKANAANGLPAKNTSSC